MKRSLLCLIAIAIVAVPVSAADRGLYLGAGLGLASFDAAAFNPDYEDLWFEEDNFGFRVFGGYRIMKYLAVELTYNDFGTILKREVSSTLIRQRFSVGIDSWDASVVGMLPLGAKASLFAKVGAASWNADILITLNEVPEEESLSGTELIAGAGVDFVFKKVGMRAEIDWLQIADITSAFIFSLNLTYHF